MRSLIVTESLAAAAQSRRALQDAQWCRIIGFVDGLRPCAATVAREQPELVVIDMQAPWAALDRAREIRSAARDAKIVLLSADIDARTLEEAADAGVDAAIAKSPRAASVGMLIREVALGNVYHTFSRGRSCDHDAVAVADLTARELEILRLVAGGMANARIAAALFVTEQTVKFHLSNIYRKLGLANRTEASHYAHINGLLGPSPATGSDARFGARSIVAAA